MADPFRLSLLGVEVVFTGPTSRTGPPTTDHRIARPLGRLWPTSTVPSSLMSSGTKARSPASGGITSNGPLPTRRNPPAGESPSRQEPAITEPVESHQATMRAPSGAPGGLPSGVVSPSCHRNNEFPALPTRTRPSALMPSALTSCITSAARCVQVPPSRLRHAAARLRVWEVKKSLSTPVMSRVVPSRLIRLRVSMGFVPQPDGQPRSVHDLEILVHRQTRPPFAIRKTTAPSGLRNAVSNWTGAMPIDSWEKVAPPAPTDVSRSRNNCREKFAFWMARNSCPDRSIAVTR